MTNFEIITKAAIAEGIYTEEEVKAMFESGHSLPLHTFAEWKRLGFKVKKGEKACLSCQIWRYKNKKDEEKGEEDESYFYYHNAHFFSDKQVERETK